MENIELNFFFLNISNLSTLQSTEQIIYGLFQNRLGLSVFDLYCVCNEK